MYPPQKQGTLTVNQVMVEGEWIRFESERAKNQFKAALMIALEPDHQERYQHDRTHINLYR